MMHWIRNLRLDIRNEKDALQQPTPSDHHQRKCIMLSALIRHLLLKETIDSKTTVEISEIERCDRMIDEVFVKPLSVVSR